MSAREAVAGACEEIEEHGPRSFTRALQLLWSVPLQYEYVVEVHCMMISAMLNLG